MVKTVADALWEMLVAAGVRRCYGIASRPDPRKGAMARQSGSDLREWNRRRRTLMAMPRWWWYRPSRSSWSGTD